MESCGIEELTAITMTNGMLTKGSDSLKIRSETFWSTTLSGIVKVSLCLLNRWVLFLALVLSSTSCEGSNEATTSVAYIGEALAMKRQTFPGKHTSTDPSCPKSKRRIS
jgi:hypothetical protein